MKLAPVLSVHDMRPDLRRRTLALIAAVALALTALIAVPAPANAATANGTTCGTRDYVTLSSVVFYQGSYNYNGRHYHKWLRQSVFWAWDRTYFVVDCTAWHRYH